KYAGQKVYIGLHYTTYDGFLTQVDQFFVGNPNASTVADVGAVIKYNIYVDGILAATSPTPSCTLSNLSAGAHTVGIEAVYASGKSKTVNYTLNTSTGIQSVNKEDNTNTANAASVFYNLNGEKVSAGSTNHLPKGVYIQVDRNGNHRKVMIK
ncbi:MAG: hypothetical protein HXL34_06450, partial [Prevotellaceae bacterium]|nr:hypothetical protein [Prevotellaceae bacterium]